MSSFFLQLLIISAFGISRIMAQSAPVNDVTKRSTRQGGEPKEFENDLYVQYAAQSLYDA